MIATKAPVAFQMMLHTTGMSDSEIAPVNSARVAPPIALQPMPSPRGCQITSVIVATKIRMAISIRQRAHLSETNWMKPLPPR